MKYRNLLSIVALVALAIIAIPAPTIARNPDPALSFSVRVMDADNARIGYGGAHLSALPPLGYAWVVPDGRACPIIRGEVKAQRSSTVGAANVASATIYVRCNGAKPAD